MSMSMGADECDAVVSILVLIDGAPSEIEAELSLTREDVRAQWLSATCKLHPVKEPARTWTFDASVEEHQLHVTATTAYRVIRESDDSSTTVVEGVTTDDINDMLGWTVPDEVFKDPAYFEHAFDWLRQACCVTFELQAQDPQRPGAWRHIKTFDCPVNELE